MDGQLGSVLGEMSTGGWTPHWHLWMSLVCKSEFTQTLRSFSGKKCAHILHNQCRKWLRGSHDLRNEPSHVFGDQTYYSNDFSAFQRNPSVPDNERDKEDQATVPTAAEQTIEEQINTIIQTETELQISPQDECDAA